MPLNYWVGKRTTDDEAILVYDPSIQTSETYVYLFNYHTVKIERLERKETRKVIKKVNDFSEQQLALETYLDWLNTGIGKRFFRAVNRIQSPQQPSGNVDEFYGRGYWDGYYDRPPKTFPFETLERCRREYHRGYRDGANDLAAEQSLNFESLPDDVDE